VKSIIENFDQTEVEYSTYYRVLRCLSEEVTELIKTKNQMKMLPSEIFLKSDLETIIRNLDELHHTISEFERFEGQVEKLSDVASYILKHYKRYRYTADYSKLPEDLKELFEDKHITEESEIRPDEVPTLVSAGWYLDRMVDSRQIQSWKRKSESTSLKACCKQL
jgi:hypothetical protein